MQLSKTPLFLENEESFDIKSGQRKQKPEFANLEFIRGTNRRRRLFTSAERKVKDSRSSGMSQG